MNNLLVSAGLVVDIIFFVLLLLGLFVGVKKGFVRGVCAIAGTVLSLGIAIACCRKFQAFIDVALGLNMTGAIQGLLAKTIPSVEIANSVGEWLSIAVSFILLVVLVRLLAWLVGLIGKSLVSKVKFFKVMDHILGGLLGLVEAFLTVFLLLAICTWIPWDALHSFIESSSVVSKIVAHPWFEYAVNFPALIIKPTEPTEPEAWAILWNTMAQYFN